MWDDHMLLLINLRVTNCLTKLKAGHWGARAPVPSDRWSPNNVGTALGPSGGEKQAQGDLSCTWVPQAASDWGITSSTSSDFKPFCSLKCWVPDTVLQPGVKLVPPAVEVWSLNHWIAREFPRICFLPRLFPPNSHVADNILVLQPGVSPEPLRWESRVQDIGLPETSRPNIISISESSPKDLHPNAKTQLHSTTNKLQCWTPYAKQLARQEHNPTH